MTETVHAGLQDTDLAARPTRLSLCPSVPPSERLHHLLPSLSLQVCGIRPRLSALPLGTCLQLTCQV